MAFGQIDERLGFVVGAELPGEVVDELLLGLVLGAVDIGGHRFVGVRGRRDLGVGAAPPFMFSLRASLRRGAVMRLTAYVS